MTTLVSVPFHNQTLPAILVDSIPHVAMKPICENIGITWNSQFERIKRHPVLNSTIRVIRTVAEDGKIRDMVTMPIEYLNGWLFGIDANRVRAESKDKLIEYQKECFHVLANHFMPAQRNLISPEQKSHIQDIVIGIRNNQGIHYATTYRNIKSNFNVDSYHNLTKEQYPAVCRFLGAKPKYLDNMPSEGQIPALGIQDIPEIKNAAFGQRFILRVCNDQTEIVPVPEGAAIVTPDQLKNNIEEVVPGHTLIKKSVLSDLTRTVRCIGVAYDSSMSVIEEAEQDTGLKLYYRGEK